MDSTTELASTLRKASLPLATTTLSLLAASTGILALIRPYEMARGFGIATPATKQSTPSSSATTAFIRAYAARNIATGLSGLAITAFWRYSEICRTSVVAETAVRRVLGITYLVGTGVCVLDAFAVGEYGREVEGVDGEAVEVARGQSLGHAVMGVLIFGLGWVFWVS